MSEDKCELDTIIDAVLDPRARDALDAIKLDIAKGDQTITTIAQKLAYRTPQLNKPMGHIVLERDEAERIVTAWRALFGKQKPLTPEEVERLKKAWEAGYGKVP